MQHQFILLTFLAMLIWTNPLLEDFNRGILNNDNHLYQPNAFSPNGDGINDVFYPIQSTEFTFEEYTLIIFNRWGDLIFQSNDSTLGWDGNIEIDGKSQAAADDVYTWKVNYTIVDETDSITVTGHICLIR